MSEDNAVAAEGASPDDSSLEWVRLPIKGGKLKFRIDTAPQVDIAYFCMGVRKSGSTMLGNIFKFLARRNKVNLVDIAGTAFKNGFVFGHWEDADLSTVVRPGNAYFGFRNFAPGLNDVEVFRRSPKILMFRDPRDALVSQYYSDAFSHSLPPEGSGEGREIFLEKRKAAQEAEIDDYVLDKAGSMRATMMGYEPMLDDETCLTFRYEDYVFQKRRLIHKMLQHFGWECHPRQIDNLLESVDVVPEEEDGKRFVRKAIPGDHRNKLKPDTIRQLNGRLREVMERFDYY